MRNQRFLMTAKFVPLNVSGLTFKTEGLSKKQKARVFTTAEIIAAALE